jgi:hypothetical protein
MRIFKKFLAEVPEMGLFSEMLEESKILNRCAGSKNILMITCPGCACESLSYTEDLPCRALNQGKDYEKNAFAVHQIRDKWNEKLTQMGMNVNHLTIAYPCEMFDTECELIRKSLSDNDTIAILACSSGYLGIKDILPDFKGKYVPMMKTSGTFVFKLVKDETGQYSKVDKDSARIIRFREKQTS